MPEIPKKKVPEERKPVPRKEEEVPPPPKGIVSPSSQELSLCSSDFVSFVIWVHCGCISLFFIGLQWDHIKFLKVHNISKVPALPKKPVPEEKVAVPVPVAKKAPPPRGRICLNPLTKKKKKSSSVLNSCFFHLVCAYTDPLSHLQWNFCVYVLVICNLFSHFASQSGVLCNSSPNSRKWELLKFLILNFNFNTFLKLKSLRKLL